MPSSPSRHPLNSFKLPTPKKHSTIERTARTSTPSSAVLRLIGNAEQQKALRTAGRRSGELSKASSEDLHKKGLGADLSKQITRRWKQGDVFAPHDLSEVEMAKWKKRGKPVYDAFDLLDFKPQDSYSVQLLDYVRVYDAHGTDYAFERYGVETGQSETDCAGD
ncbi:hypothetical protein D0Z07_1228 [Hyphodiscus hymeniophilus]|uniref:Uncharacterized protein n=1 Tax=Hyphodiscus hymeniophilus TaxID=353542 RepID=A0A9P6VQD8_9HELO|nr:hypothetical protein D0Z07_1228 [Hyphodiscus hymeniophilus]